MDAYKRIVASIPSLVLFLLSVVVFVAVLMHLWYVVGVVSIVEFIFGIVLISGRPRKPR